MVFYSISSNINELLLISPSAKVFFFGDFNVHHKDWLTYSGGTDRSGEFSYNLTQMVNFPTRIPGCDSHLTDVPWEDILKLSASAAASEFRAWVQVGIDVYIPHHKYQVKPHSSPWFSAACAAAIIHRNHFFRLNQQTKSSECKIKFRETSNHCKKVLEAAKLAYANKTKESITSQKLGSWDFWQIANSVINKGKSVIPPLFNSLEVLPSALDKAKLFPENFSKNSNLDDSGISSPVFPS